ncbi:MAG: hypothetical protein ACI8XB_003210 [Patiriisocius sp.]|jgi:hypothetical protein
MSTEELLEDIRKKTEVLANMKKDLITRNQVLESEIVKLKADASKGAAEIEEMKGRLKIVKMAKTLEAVEEKGTDSKYRINQMVKEIDKCIAMLSS